MTYFLVISDLTPGGAQKQILILAHKLSMKNRVYLFTWQNEKSDFYGIDENIITRISLAGKFTGRIGIFGYPFRILKFRKCIIDVKPKVIISFLPEISAMAIIASTGLNVPNIASLRHNPRNEKISIKNSVYYRLISKNVKCVFQSQEVLDWFQSKYNYRKQLAVISNFQESYNIFRNLSRFEKIPPRDSFFVAIGTKVFQKGFDLLLEAYDQAHDQLANKKLVIIGIDQKKEKKILNNYLSKMINKNSVILINQTSNVDEWLKYSYCFVLSSRFEGIPNVLIEALQNNKAVISFDCPSGPRELLSNGYLGSIVKNMSVSELKQEMIRFANNIDLRNSYESKLKFVHKFKMDEVESKWFALLKNP